MQGAFVGNSLYYQAHVRDKDHNQTGAELFADVDKQEDLLLSHVHLSPGFVPPSASPSSNRRIIMSANIDAERIVAKAKELFPEYFSLQELKLKLGKLQWERAKLADAKVRTTRLISLS
jgi:hypothetical protein